MATIPINGISLDPLAQRLALLCANLDSTDGSRSDYILIQTKQPLDKGQKDEMARLGATILEQVPESTYIAHYPPADLSPTR